MSDAAAHGHDLAHDHPKVPYFGIAFTLFVFTAITILVAVYVNLGSKAANVILAIAIAAFKGSLVMAFFMHLKYEQRWWASLVLFPLALVLIIIGSNLPDTGMNGPGRGEGDPDRTDLILPGDPVIKHAGQAAPAKH